MITDTNYFKGKLDDINQELETYKLGVEKIRKIITFKLTKQEITEKYEDIFMNLPYQIENSTEKIGFSIDLLELFDFYYSLSDFTEKIDPEKTKEIKLKRENEYNDLNEMQYLIYDYIEEYIHNLVYEYKKVIENTRKHFFFADIEDEKIILMNLLKRYKSVLNDETKQINVFWGIRLSKKISNIVLEILIEFIEQRLNILTIKIDIIQSDYKTTYIENSAKPLKWLGTQQELVELIIELNRKNWIPNIEDGERKKFISSITNLFDLENTKRNVKSNTENSMYQQFKGEYIDGERTYPFLEQHKYEKKFTEIRKNNG